MALQVWLPLTNANRIQNHGLLGDLTITTTPSIIAGGKLGGTLNGGGYKMSADQTKMCLNNKEFSCAFWVKVTSSAERKMFFGNDYPRQFSIFNYPTINDLHLSWANSAGTNVFSSVDSGVFPTNVWTHCCVTYNNPTVTVYINGNVLRTYSYTCDLTDFAKETQVIHTATGRYLNDFRVYNHCLSPKEVKEISKGLVLHYKMDDGHIEPTTNLAPYPTPGGAVNPGWDTSKHPNAISVSGWGSGYNGGVGSPEKGYHACWNVIDGIPTIVYRNLNSEIGAKGRWLGVASEINSNITAGATYTISFEAKSTNSGVIDGGIYYNNSGNGFHDGTFWVTTTSEWKKYSKTFTAKVAHTGALYIYGNNGNEGIKYVRNVQIELKDHATPYTPTSRSETTVYDCSGFGNNGSTTSTNYPITDSDSPRYGSSLKFNGSQYINAGKGAKVSDSFSVCWWGYMDNWSSYGRATSCTESGGWNFEANSGTYMVFNVNVNGTYYGVSDTSTTFSSLTGWHHWVGTYDNNTLKIYRDGELKGTNATGTNKPVTYNSTNNIWIGVEAAGGETYDSGVWFKGKLSDYRIYATPLSAEDVKELYNTSAMVCDNGTVMAYSLEE